MGITQQIGASSLIKPGVIDSATVRPASPYEGQVIFQKDTDQLLVWNGTAWVIPNAPAQNPDGLAFIATATVSGGSSISVNNCFSSTYDNYLVIASLAGTNNTQIRIKLRNGTTDNSSNYAWGGFYFDMIGGGSLNGEGSGGYVGTGVRILANNNSGVSNAFVQIGKPFAVSQTTFNIQPQASENYTRMFTGVHQSNYSADGIVINIDAGTFTGSVSVYGYRK